VSKETPILPLNVLSLQMDEFTGDGPNTDVLPKFGSQGTVLLTITLKMTIASCPGVISEYVMSTTSISTWRWIPSQFVPVMRTQKLDKRH
jgi:hypothetical protein